MRRALSDLIWTLVQMSRFDLAKQLSLIPPADGIQAWDLCKQELDKALDVRAKAARREEVEGQLDFYSASELCNELKNAMDELELVPEVEAALESRGFIVKPADLPVPPLPLVRP